MTVAFVAVVAVLIALFLFVFQLSRSADLTWKKRIRITMAIVVLFILGLCVWAFIIEPNRLILHQETIALNNGPKELDGLRIALISDIHTGGPFINDRKLRQIVELTNQQSPDLIVLLGDYMSPNSWHSHRVEPEVTAAALKYLHAPLGVYTVLGNHDWWYNGQRVWRAFESQGIRVLENDVAEVQWQGGSFWLVGLSDLWTRPQRIKETLAKVPADKAIIVLTHNPDVFPKIPSSVPLVLAGHTHGGQVNFPLIGRVVLPSGYGQRYAAGYVQEDGHDLFVTTGIGTSIFPVRFRVPPEIVILTLKS
jgi:hypothetical protein